MRNSTSMLITKPLKMREVNANITIAIKLLRKIPTKASRKYSSTYSMKRIKNNTKLISGK